MGNGFHRYREFAYAFNLKVKAAQRVLNYQWGKDLNELDAAIPLMEQSLDHYRKLVALTDSTYYYANSMQTAQRRIPIGGDGGKNKTWKEMLVHYENELANFKANLQLLKDRAAGKVTESAAEIKPLSAANVKILNGLAPVKLATGARQM